MVCGESGRLDTGSIVKVSLLSDVKGLAFANFASPASVPGPRSTPSCPGQSTVSGAIMDVRCCRERAQRVDGPVIDENLVVEMGTRRMSRGANQAERGSLVDHLP